YRSDEDRALVLGKADQLAAALRDADVRVHVDLRDGMTPGAKYYEWERRGVPLRIEIGPRDVKSEQVVVVRRVAPEGAARKEIVPEARIAADLPERLDAFQRELLAAALARREANSYRGVTDYGELKSIIEG